MLYKKESKSESEVAQSCQTVYDPMDCSLPGFSVHGIFQARVLEWVAIWGYSKKKKKYSLFTWNSNLIEQASCIFIC